MLSSTRELRPSPSFPLPGCLALELNLRERCLVGRRVISFSCVSPPVEDLPKEACHTLMEPAVQCLKQNTLKMILTYIIWAWILGVGNKPLSGVYRTRSHVWGM